MTMTQEVTTTTPDPPAGMELVRMHTRVEPIFDGDDTEPSSWETVERTYVWAPPAVT
jgi:hypothetical protein